MSSLGRTVPSPSTPSCLSAVFGETAYSHGLSELATTARSALSGLPLDAARAAGIWRDRSHYFLNISYPSLQAMQPIEPAIVTGQRTSTGKRVALYVHIPFCTAECYYCHYYKLFAQSKETVGAYVDGVLQELDLHVRRFGGLQAESVYIGGGTPSYMTPAQIDRLFNGIRDRVDIHPAAEISFEIHPESGTQDRLDVLHRHGVNRVSVGVESLDDDVLRGEHRRHTVEDVLQLWNRLGTTGITNVNLDLIYGLRGQTLAGWERNLHQIESIRPSSATMYYLRLKRGTPEYKLWRKYPETFPTDYELLLMHAMSFELMESRLSYTQNPVDWFIKDTRYFHAYQDHNWRRSDDVELLGIGASAYSYIDGWQYYNVNDAKEYSARLGRSQLPIWKGELLEHGERMRRTVMLGLKMGIDRSIFRATYGIDVVQAFPEEWQRLTNLSMVEYSADEVRLTYLGKLFADEVGQQFYSAEMKQRMEAVHADLVSTTWPQFNPFQ